MQRRAVIVATARTPIGRAGRGAFNETYPQTLASHAIQHALSRSGLEPERIDDVILGAAMQVGANGGNVARQSLLLAGLPDSVPGMCIDRACSSGLMAIATAAKQIIVDGETAVIAGGVESISLVRADYLNASHRQHPVLLREMPAIYMSMLETAEIVAANHHISREAQDEFALQSQQRTARAQAEGRFDDEIVALTTVMSVTDPETQQLTKRTVTLSQDEGNRPDTTLAGLAALKPVLSDGQRIRRGATVTAGNASQLSDGASVCVLMDSLEAEKRGIEPLGAYLGMAVAGCDPAEMGIGPMYAIPKLLKQHRLTSDDVGLWELNEAFASQAVYCRDQLGIPTDRMNVNGGAIAVGHPYGMSGARMTGHLLLEGRRRAVRYGVAAMCIAGGMGGAALFEIYS